MSEEICNQEACSVDVEYCYFDFTYSEYAQAVHGGKAFYRQNKPGTSWFDKVNNANGWTIDFNLEVLKIENSFQLSNTDNPNGIGIYVNDGVYQESIYFLQQEILFKNAGVQIVFDTTQATQYRLIGKKDNLRLYARRNDKISWMLIANVGSTVPATPEGNGRKPSVFQESNGDSHSVWYDDGNKVGQIIYSRFSDSVWSEPEVISNDQFGAQNAKIVVGNNGNIYVVFESQASDSSTISFIYKNDLGWSQIMYLHPGSGSAKNPKISLDSKDNLHIVWEDYRFGQPEILYTTFNTTSLAFSDFTRITNTQSGCFRPSVSTYFESVYVSYTERNEDSLYAIKVKYKGINNVWSEASEATGYVKRNADYSDISVAVDGRVFVVWHDDVRAKNYDIYGRVFNSILTNLTPDQRITATSRDSKFPVLGISRSNSDIYIVWEDTRAGLGDVDFDQDIYGYDPYRVDYGPIVYIAYFDFSMNRWFSSGQGDYDTRIEAGDPRKMYSPVISPQFSGELHILYESEMVLLTDAYLPQTQQFIQIRDAVYDLSSPFTFFLVRSVYLDRDALVSGRINRKELRFGHFSDTINGTYRFKNFKYYLKDAVEPFELTEVSQNTFNSTELRVNQSVINDYGDVWLATLCGLYFYFQKDKTFFQLDHWQVKNRDIRAITFDANNVLYAATGTTVLYSLDHTNFKALTVTGSTISGTISSLAFDKTNRLIVGSTTGAYIIEVEENPLEPNPADDALIDPYLAGLTIAGTQVDTFAASQHITAIAVDNNNIIWATSRNGLYRYIDGNTINFTTTHGLSTNWLNDISIRNSAIRYIASPAGVFKMVGTTFEKVSTENGGLHNNNVKSILWQEPNIIWAGTLSYINQIYEMEDGTYATTAYPPSSYSSFTSALDDKSVYYIVLDEDESIPVGAEVEVYINGNRIHHGYNVSVSSENAKVIKFETPLLSTDMVDVIIRKDIVLLTSFAQSQKEKQSLGNNVVRVRKVQTVDGSIYISVDGDENDVRLNDASSSVPYDCIHLDTNPPSGCLEIVERIDNSTVRLTISDATDGENGSGIDTMIISNNSNFTSDGTTPLTPIPFSTNILHDFVASSGGTTTSLSFASGTGSKLKYFEDTGHVYASTSKPARLYRLNNSTGSWTSVVTFANDEYVDFIARFNNKFLVGIGHDVDNAKIYIYNDNGSFVSPTIRTLSGNRAYAAEEFLNTLYIGSGGDGKIYAFDGDNISVAFEGLSTNIYSLASTSSSLFAGSGESGRIYRLDPAEEVSLISHQDSDDAVLSMAAMTFDGRQIVFAGASTEGKILRTFVTEDSFNKSFHTTSNPIRVLKTINNVTYAVIGKAIYSFGNTGIWTWRAANSEDIYDVVAVDDTLYYLTASSVKKISPTDEYFNIYMKLIDKAGNESVLFDGNGSLIPCQYISVDIDDLQDFVTENRILELDEFGNVVYSLSGTDRFFSAQKIIEEKGVYDSQIFDGTNDIIKWDTATWTSNEPSGTKVQMYFRTSVSKTDILTQDWIGPYDRLEQNGFDLSFLSGQYLQFRAVLTSEIKSVSPSLSRVVIGALTSESVHFFTTNFVLPGRITKGILTSQKMVPVSSDIVFAINTTDSVDWGDYQVIDENRLFTSNQFGNNLRVGIRLISPSRSALLAAEFDEYGPYHSNLYVNTLDFRYRNTEASGNFEFKVSFYSDVNLQHLVYSDSSEANSSHFSVDGEDFPEDGQLISNNDSARILYSPPGDANLQCNTYYFTKVEARKADEDWQTILNDKSFILGCSPSFVDNIEFEFNNSTDGTKFFHFRARFYRDAQRTDLYRTELSANNRDGWVADGNNMTEEGVETVVGETVNIAYRPDPENFDSKTLYYLTIDAFDGTDFILASNAYTFQSTDVSSLIYCGPYMDVPVVKKVALIFELLNNELLTLNLK